MGEDQDVAGSKGGWSSAPADDFDYSTPEAQHALEGLSDLVLEIRQEVIERGYERRIRLYERTLGLAVIPELLRRAAVHALRRSGTARRIRRAIQDRQGSHR